MDLQFSTMAEDENFYSILGCDENSSCDQIIKEFKMKAIKEHPDRNSNHILSTERFQQLQRAKDTLTDPIKRADYDKWRHSGLAISFDKWCSLNDSVKTSLHWATKNPKTQSIEHPVTPNDSKKNVTQVVLKPFNYKSHAENYVIGDFIWQREPGNDMLRKFRNYEI